MTSRVLNTRISKCELYEFEAPLAIPMPRTNITKRGGVYVRIITTDGRDAYGEISPLPGFSRETLGEAKEQAFRVARQISNLQLSVDVIGTTGPPSGNLFPSVLCGFEGALWKLNKFGHGQALNSDNNAATWSMPQMRTQIDVCALLSGSAEEIAAQTRLRLSQGYKTFKLKVGSSDPEQDISVIRNVREAIGGASRLRLDANCSWSREEAEHVLKNTTEIDFEYVEEPLRDPSGYGALAAAVPVPIALDESTDIVLKNNRTANPDSVKKLSWLRALILKPMIRRGIRESMRLAGAASRSGIESVVSSSFESRIGFESLLLLAGSLPGAGLAMGLDTLHYFQAESDMANAPVLNVETLENRAPEEKMSLNRIF